MMKNKPRLKNYLVHSDMDTLKHNVLEIDQKI